MMLATSAIATAAAITASVFSPISRTTCKKRVAPSRFRYEPYGARVIATMPPVESPVKFSAAAAAAAATSVMVGCRVPSPVDHHVCPATPVKAPVVCVPAMAATTKAVHAPGPRFAVIKFKHESFTFLAPFKIAVGDIVVVEGDRGENIGEVAEISKEAPNFHVASRVMRRATDKDLAALTIQREREMAATLSTRALAESLGLHGRVEDAEYQFDMNKLTIFVRRATKSTFVDFRKLQRTLFREFRCRIWCSYMDEVEAAEAGPRLR